MSFTHLSRRVVDIKIAYVGPSLGGRRTSIEAVRSRTPPELRGDLVFTADPTHALSFGFTPARFQPIRGNVLRVHLRAVLGTRVDQRERRQLLAGSDGILFVADSQAARREENARVREEVDADLAELCGEETGPPLVFQYNKRDLADVASVEDLDLDLNQRAHPRFEAVATRCEGVVEALRECIVRAVSSLLAG